MLLIAQTIVIIMALSGAAPSPPEQPPYERALEHYRAGRLEQAAAILESEIGSSGSDEAGIQSLLGWCRFRQGRIDGAMSAFTRALALSPENADAMEGVARAAARLGLDKQALDAIALLARLHPEVDLRDVALQVLSRPGSLNDARLGRARATGAQPRMVSRARGDYFEVRENDGAWVPIFVKGVNLGAALPGRYPSEFPREQGIYEKWLRQMSEMGANVVRLYTLLPPEFYRALSRHNTGRSHEDGFIWLVQGVWTELPEDDVSYDAPAFRAQFLTEMERVIDAVHGNIAVPHRRGHAFGLYDTDVSDMTLGFILGREWEPYSVAAYDESRPHPASYRGDYFTLAEGTPTEAWFASVLDHAVRHEMDRYHAQRPVSFTNWPTLDPIHHPTEATKAEEIVILKKLNLPQEPGTLLEYDNDGVGIDPMKIMPTSRTPSGTFASYHAYPYYPDFMNVDPGYLQSSGAKGPSNYAGYLRELKKHHEGMPVLIAEVGVPTSRGIAHHQPQGWHHGGHTEQEQGEINALLMENIHETGCAGGILFAWIDEWFKKNWLVVAFEVPWDNNKNWLNILDPEQNYGLTALKPGAGGWKIVIDGKGTDWDPVPAIAGDGKGKLRSLRVTHDEAYIYLRLDVDHINWRQAHYAIGIDTYGAAEGDHRMPFDLGLSTPTGLEFVVDLSGPATSRLLCDLPYDLHTNRFTRPWKSVRNDDGLFTEMLAETNRRRVGRDGTVYPAIVYSRSPLRFGTMDPDSPAYDDLVEWNANVTEGFIELRIGWNLLNVTDPSTRQVLDDPVPPKGGAGHRTTDGFRFYVASWRPEDHRLLATLPGIVGDGRFMSDVVPFYTWEPWEEPTWHSYLKKSYFILKDRLAPLRPVVGTGAPR